MTQATNMEIPRITFERFFDGNEDAFVAYRGFVGKEVCGKFYIYDLVGFDDFYDEDSGVYGIDVYRYQNHDYEAVSIPYNDHAVNLDEAIKTGKAVLRYAWEKHWLESQQNRNMSKGGA